MEECFNCKRTEDDEMLLAFRHKGKYDYVCVKCMPMLIHG
jgi:plastocyanin